MLPIPYALDALNFLVRRRPQPVRAVRQRVPGHKPALEPDRCRTGDDGKRAPRHSASDPDRRRDRYHARQARRHRPDDGGDDAVAAVIIFAAPTFWPMAIALSILAVAGDAFVPAVSALTLGLVTKDKLARRLGRNSASTTAATSPSRCSPARSATPSPSAPSFSWFPSSRLLTSAAVLAIPADAINHDRARDLPPTAKRKGRRPDIACCLQLVRS